MTDAADHLDHASAGAPCARKRNVVGLNGWKTTISTYGGQVFRWVTAHKGQLKPIAMLAALTLFCVGLFLSLRASPDILQRIQIGPLLIIILGTLPAGLALSAMDFQAMARLSDVKVRFWSAAEVVLYSRAASLLPVPGSFAVRMTVLKAQGATFKRSGGLMFLFTALWGGIGFCFSAAWLSFQAPLLLTAVFLAVGLGILVVCCWFVRKSKFDWRIASRAAMLRFGLIALEALTLMFAVQSVGVNVEYYQTAILVVAPFLAGVVPAGIGVRETIIAALSPIAGIDPVAGFLAATAARLSGMAFLVVCALSAFIIRRVIGESS